jgi:hypothetical protein
MAVVQDTMHQVSLAHSRGEDTLDVATVEDTDTRLRTLMGYHMV